MKKSGHINDLKRALNLSENYGDNGIDEMIRYCNYFVIPNTTFDDVEKEYPSFNGMGINLVYRSRELRSGYLKQNNYEFSERQLWELLCSNLLDFAHIGHYIE